MERSPTLSLRERQKEGRRARIIAAAKSLFVEAGLDNITIEAIAEIAGVSSVTVHNYYGTKSGVLLALVAESDRELLETLDKELTNQPDDLVDLLLRFFTIICDHTLTHLDKSVWRQVISASVDGREPRFNKLYRELDHKLASVLIREIEQLRAAGQLADSVNSTHLGWALFNLQNARFVEFIASDNKTRDQALHDLRNDLLALFTFVIPTR